MFKIQAPNGEVFSYNVDNEPLAVQQFVYTSGHHCFTRIWQEDDLKNVLHEGPQKKVGQPHPPAPPKPISYWIEDGEDGFLSHYEGIDPSKVQGLIESIENLGFTKVSEYEWRRETEFYKIEPYYG